MLDQIRIQPKEYKYTTVLNILKENFIARIKNLCDSSIITSHKKIYMSLLKKDIDNIYNQKKHM